MVNRMLKCVGVLVTMVAVIGCDEDKRVAEIAEQAAKRQAEQDLEMARLNREVAEGTKRLVDASAVATDKTLSMQQDLQEQHNQLDSERQKLAAERNRESVLVPMLQTLGILIACSLPLVLCWKLLAGFSTDPEADTICEILAEELAADRSPLFPPADGLAALPDHSLPRATALLAEADELAGD
jgi:hypothetical protein